MGLKAVLWTGTGLGSCLIATIISSAGSLKGRGPRMSTKKILSSFKGCFSKMQEPKQSQYPYKSIGKTVLVIWVSVPNKQEGHTRPGLKELFPDGSRL